MDPLAWLLTTFGPTWAPAVILLVGWLGPKLVTKMAGHPVIAGVLSWIIAKVKPSPDPAPAVPDPAPAPVNPAAPPSISGPLKTLFDLARKLFAGQPAAAYLEDDPGSDAGRINAFRLFHDRLAGEHFQELQVQMRALGATQVPAPAADPGSTWPGGVNVVSKPAA